MKNGICPSCGGNEIYHQPGSKIPNENIVLSEGIGRANIIAIGMKVTAPDKYVCAGCGYLAYYLPSHEDIQIVRENWARVRPA